MVEQAARACFGSSRHPGLRWLEDLCLITSAELWDNRFGAFLYSNACAVAGLRAAARLAEAAGKASAAEPWIAQADRIWNSGILGQPASNGKGLGLVDPTTGRFLDARRLSTLRGMWTDRPEWLVERSAACDISQLGLAVPFELLPASDPHLRLTAEAIMRHNTVAGEPNLLTRWSFDPSHPNPRHAPSQAHRQEFSSLATLWMARYLIQLGRETGEGRQLNRALVLVDAVIDRLGPLGLALQLCQPGDDDVERRSTVLPGVWALHAHLIEVFADLIGLEYDASQKRLSLQPVLPPAWPRVGSAHRFGCGQVDYHFEREDEAGIYRLTLRLDLNTPISVHLDLTCPGLSELGAWQARPGGPSPRFDRATGRLVWMLDVPAGASNWEWSWGNGKAAEHRSSAVEGRGVGSVTT
jgi:hypothetical protein